MVRALAFHQCCTKLVGYNQTHERFLLVTTIQFIYSHCLPAYNSCSTQENLSKKLYHILSYFTLLCCTLSFHSSASHLTLHHVLCNLALWAFYFQGAHQLEGSLNVVSFMQQSHSRSTPSLLFPWRITLPFIHSPLFFCSPTTKTISPI